MFASFAVFWASGAAMIMIAGNQVGWTSKDGRPKNPPPRAIQIGFPLFGLPFFAVGLFLATAPRRAARAARYTAYALTDQRVIVIDGKSSSERSIITYSGPDFARCTREEYGSGLGDLVIGQAPTNLKMNHRPVTRPVGLIGIEDPHGVQRLIERTLPASSNQEDPATTTPRRDHE